MNRKDIRLALPSKGILQGEAEALLAACGLGVFRPNPRQYAAKIPALPGVTVMLQRPSDIVAGIKTGTLDMGITGLDIASEYGDTERVLMLHEALGFGPCTLNLAVPEAVEARTMADLAEWAHAWGEDGRSLRIATKFPKLTGQFLEQHDIGNFELITVEGTLAIAPAIGYADLIADLVSSGVTLRDNHLRPLDDGLILRSQAVLIGNRQALQTRPEVLQVARQLIEYIEAHLRAQGSYLIIANVRGDSPEAVARQMYQHPHIRGLQGPTIAPVVPHNGLAVGGEKWFAINIVVRKSDLIQAIAELRTIGGSGVIVAPLTYIFEEEPERSKALLAAISGDSEMR
jgi:ATP phosphoribosyltransferase